VSRRLDGVDTALQVKEKNDTTENDVENDKNEKIQH
jgi:hypothetical protein